MLTQLMPRNLERVLKQQELSFAYGIDLTYRCNLRCLHCYEFLPKDKELTFSQIKEKLDDLAYKGCIFFIISGGEPLLRKDFFQITQYAKDKGFALILRTNGTLITKAIAKEIKKLNPFQVSITLLGASAVIHDKIAGIKGSFKKSIKAIKFLKEQGIKVLIVNTLIKQNVGEAKEVKALADSLGVFYRSSRLSSATNKDCLLEKRI